MASDLYDRILRVERRLRAIDLGPLSNRQRANAFALIGSASRQLLDRNGEIRGEQDSGGCGYLDIYVFDGSDAPFEGATVAASLQLPGQPSIWAGSSATAADGHATIGIALAGVYLVSASVPGGPADSKTVSAACGGPTSVAFRLNLTAFFSPCGRNISRTLNLNDSVIGDIDLVYDAADQKWKATHAAPKTGSPWTIHYEFDALGFNGRLNVYGMNGTTVDTNPGSGGQSIGPSLTCTPFQFTDVRSYSSVSDFYNSGPSTITYKITEK